MTGPVRPLDPGPWKPCEPTVWPPAQQLAITVPDLGCGHLPGEAHDGSCDYWRGVLTGEYQPPEAYMVNLTAGCAHGDRRAAGGPPPAAGRPGPADRPGPGRCRVIPAAKDVPVFLGLLIGLPIGAALWGTAALIAWSLA